MTNIHNNYTKSLRQAVLDDTSFVRLVCKGHILEGTLPWRQVIVRPVFVKHERHLQFSYFTAKQDITQNYRGNEAERKLDELLCLPFNNIVAQSTSETLQVQFAKKGKPVMHRTAITDADQPALLPDLSHDRQKKLLLPANRPDAFLQASGIMNEQGHIRPGMHDKFTQINEFLKVLEHTGALEQIEHRPVQILDCGCGSAYLSFAAYHFLQDVRHIPARLVGIDVNATLIEKDNAQGEQLGFTDACFATSSILAYQPEPAPDIVLALHACDTASDEALSQGINAQSQVILCAPCCHHHLHEQLRVVSSMSPMSPVFHDGILKKRLGDILTDTFRALALRIMGYKTDVVEFIAPEHTDKNLMIRAVKGQQPGNAAFVKEYLALKQFWGVTPIIETLLGERLLRYLHMDTNMDAPEVTELVGQYAENSRT